MHPRTAQVSDTGGLLTEKKLRYHAGRTAGLFGEASEKRCLQSLREYGETLYRKQMEPERRRCAVQ